MLSRDSNRPLLEALALILPDIYKPFHFYVDKNNSIAKGVLIQPLGPWKRPVAYLSKKLDLVAQGWPPVSILWLPPPYWLKMQIRLPWDKNK